MIEKERQFLRITYVKLLRAYGGCLGVKCRRRTWNTAISLEKPCAGYDPGMSEWGNPALKTNVILLLNT